MWNQLLARIGRGLIVLAVGLLGAALGAAIAITANAGSVIDADSDLVPDAFDNCSTVPNGPQQGSNQVDSDLDGYGNACDADYNNDPDHLVNIPDFSIFLACFAPFGPFPPPPPPEICDHNGDGRATVADFSTFLAAFQGTPPQVGPSGLVCAGNANVPCRP